jgi:hypothetical protein
VVSGLLWIAAVRAVPERVAVPVPVQMRTAPTLRSGW